MRPGSLLAVSALFLLAAPVTASAADMPVPAPNAGASTVCPPPAVQVASRAPLKTLTTLLFRQRGQWVQPPRVVMVEPFHGVTPGPAKYVPAQTAYLASSAARPCSVPRPAAAGIRQGFLLRWHHAAPARHIHGGDRAGRGSPAQAASLGPFQPTLGQFCFTIGEAIPSRNGRRAMLKHRARSVRHWASANQQTRRDGRFCANSCARSLDRIRIRSSDLHLILSQNRSVRMAQSWLKGL